MVLLRSMLDLVQSWRMAVVYRTISVSLCIFFYFTSTSFANSYPFSKTVNIERYIATASLSLEKGIATLHVKERVVVDIVGNKIVKSFCRSLYPKFIDKHLQSNVIDYEIVRVARDGAQESYDVIDVDSEIKSINIYPSNGELLSEGKHLYEIWYRVRNKVDSSTKFHSVDFKIDTQLDIKYIDFALQLDPNLNLTNTRLEPLNKDLLVREDSAYVRVYNAEEIKNFKPTVLTINFKNVEDKMENVLLNIINSKQNGKEEAKSTLVLFFERNYLKIDFILALLASIVSVCTLVWYLRQVVKG